MKIKLSNAILGSNCYIGSDSSPIVIDFTSGTTEPIRHAIGPLLRAAV